MQVAAAYSQNVIDVSISIMLVDGEVVAVAAGNRLSDGPRRDGGVMYRPGDADLAAVRLVAACALRVSAGEVEIERTVQGVAAQVYRVVRAGDEWFLRLAEQRDQTLQVDAELLARLRRIQVRVPEVVYVHPFVEQLDRSVLLTRHIGGVSLEATANHRLAWDVARRAGRDLAMINQLPVDGFGWISRSRHCGDVVRWPLAAKLADYASFVVDDLPAPWPGAFSDLFNVNELNRLEVIIATEQAAARRAGAARARRLRPRARLPPRWAVHGHHRLR